MTKVIVKESSINRLGVFAIVNIPKNAVVLKIDDSRVVTYENPLNELKGEYEYHCDYLASGKVVLMQSPERHINHSCNPNSYVKTINKLRYVFALEAISAAEEITYDYCINGSGDTLWECNCGSQRCRKQIHSDFFHLSYELQLEYLPLLDDWYIAEYKEKVENLLSRAEIS